MSRYEPRGAFQGSLDPNRCAEGVFEGFHYYQCSRKHRPGSEWCKQHDPEEVKKRKEERDRRYQEKMDRLFSKREPTIPLTQVEALLREAWDEGWKRGAEFAPLAETRDEWIANKIKEARAPDKNGSNQETPK